MRLSEQLPLGKLQELLSCLIDRADLSQPFLQVCCPYEPRPTTPPPFVEPVVTLRANDLPPPGVCGPYVSDRIVGGNETRITGK